MVNEGDTVTEAGDMGHWGMGWKGQEIASLEKNEFKLLGMTVMLLSIVTVSYVSLSINLSFPNGVPGAFVPYSTS